MQSITDLNTCERPLSPGIYAIPYLNTWGTSPPPPRSVAHLYTTIFSLSRYLFKNQLFLKAQNDHKLSSKKLNALA